MPPELSPRTPIRLVDRVAGESTMYAWHSIALVAWEGSLSIDGVRHIDRALFSLRSLHPQVSLVHLLHGRTTLPNAEVRAEFERLSKAHERGIACTAILDNRQGFTAGAIKAVITGLLLFARVRLDIRIFGNVNELVAWLLPTHIERSGVRLSAVEFREAVQAAWIAHA